MVAIVAITGPGFATTVAIVATTGPGFATTGPGFATTVPIVATPGVWTGQHLRVVWCRSGWCGDGSRRSYGLPPGSPRRVWCRAALAGAPFNTRATFNNQATFNARVPRPARAAEAVDYIRRHHGSVVRHTRSVDWATSAGGVVSQRVVWRSCAWAIRYVGRTRVVSGVGIWRAGLADQVPANPPAMTILLLRSRFPLILATTAAGLASSFQSNRIKV